MTNFVSELDAAHCKMAVRLLEEMNSARDDFDSIYARELEWQRRTYSVFVRLREGFKKHVLRQTDPWEGIANALEADSEKTYASRTIEVRQLLLKLAIRAYELETGNSPSDVSRLVPAYLNEAPRDPSTGEALKLP